MNSTGETIPSGRCQRLRASNPDNPSARKRNNGLVVNDQLAALQAQAQIGFQLQSPHRRRVHRRIENFASGFAALFGAVHGDLGVAHHVRCLQVGIAAQGDPDAGCDHQLLSCNFVRKRQFFLHALRRADGVTGAGNIFKQHGELISAKAGNAVRDRRVASSLGAISRAGQRIGLAEARAQSPRHLQDQLIAGSMPQAVVHHFELVNVHEQDGKSGIQMPPRAGERMLQAIEKQIAVG